MGGAYCCKRKDLDSIDISEIKNDTPKKPKINPLKTNSYPKEEVSNYENDLNSIQQKKDIEEQIPKKSKITENKKLNQNELNIKELNEEQNKFQIIERKGATYYGIGMCLVRITNAIIENKNIILPVSSYDKKHDICISTPAIVGIKGVQDIIDLPLTDEEQEKLTNSINVIKEAIQKIDE